MRPIVLLTMALVLAGAPAHGQPLDADPLLSQLLAQYEVFQDGHPDLHYRRLATEARTRGDFDRARRYYTRAARHGDKLSQAALAEMHRSGEGGDRDPAVAYAWMDLAAERGTPWLIVLRERYWAELDEAGRARAVREGRSLYAEFGDPAAKPRLEAVLRTARKSVTGSRLGTIGNGLEVYPAGFTRSALSRRDVAPASPEDVYADRYWEPELYWPARDRALEAAGQAPPVDSERL